MAFKLVYTDPKKKTLQKIEIAFMAVMLPIGLYCGGLALKDYSDFKKAEVLAHEASELTHVGQYDLGIPKLITALEIYPEYYSAWEELGVSYHMSGDHQKEVESYEKAIQALPGSGNLHRELATAYHEVGEHEKELEMATLAAGLPNSDPLFTQRILQRAIKEASGEISTETVERPTHFDEDLHNQLHGVTPQPGATPAPANTEDHSGHSHDGHDHEGHDHDH